MPKNYRDEEFYDPYNMLVEQHYQVDVAGFSKKEAVGINGYKYTPNLILDNLKNKDLDNYDALVIPGGPNSVKYLWNNKRILEIIKYFYDNKKIISAICYAVIPLVQSGILKNKEVSELMKALGTGIGSDFNIDHLRYDRIICACDADPDGSHIAALVTMVLAILVPDIIKEGRYYIAQTPLFAINEKKTFIPLWDRESLEKAQNKGRTIQRYKGLGEMSPKQMKVSLIDEETRRITLVNFSEDIDKMIKLFSDPEEKRNLLNS